MVDITLADSRSVDAILGANFYLIPSLSKEGIQVSAPKYIPINNPFELSIGGLGNYEGLHEIIEKWLYYKYVHDDDSQTSCVFNTRISKDREHFIFTMDSWQSTLIVLKDFEDFHAYFTLSPDLIAPKLLFETNSSGYIRKSTASTIDARATSVNGAIADLKRDLAEFRKDQTENNSLVQHQVASIHTNMETQTDAVTRIGNQLHQFGLSLLASRDKKLIENRISAIDNSLLFESQCLRLTDDLSEKATLKANILSLQTERREQTQRLALATDTTLRLISPSPGAVISNFPSSAAPALSVDELAHALTLYTSFFAFFSLLY